MPKNNSTKNTLLLESICQDISQGRQVKLTAKGWSMLPLIKNGDTVTLSPLDDKSIQRGNIVLARSGSGRYYLHRIHRVYEERVELRGDGNPWQQEYVHVRNVFAELTSIDNTNSTFGKRSCRWLIAKYCWPDNGIFRKVLLFLCRIFVLRLSTEKMRQLAETS